MRLSVDLRFDLVSWPPHPVGATIRALAVGVTALNHESWNDSVKCGAVVKAFPCQIQKVLHMARRNIVKETQHDVTNTLAFACNRNRGSGLVRHISHSSVPFCSGQLLLVPDYGNRNGGGATPPSSP